MTKREKMLILPTRLSIQIHIQYVPLKYPRIFQTDLDHWILPTEKTCWNLGFLFFVFPCDYALEKKWQPTPVFLPGESQGQRSLVGCRLWGCTVRHD